MDLGLKGRRALVTGSTAGIGLAAARALAEEGAQVTVNGRTAGRVHAAVQMLEREVPGARVTGVAADLGRAAGCATLARQVPEVDILVNNVGIFEPKPFEEIPDEDWLRFVEMIHYGMTKTAQIAIARGAAESLVGTGVTVNSVLPGPTNSEGVGQFITRLAESKGTDAADAEREFFATARPTSIIQRFAAPDEVAAMIVYLCGQKASATTGAALRVDGGVVRAIP